MRYRPSRLLTASILSASAMLLAACATSPGRLGVDLRGLKECRRLDPKVQSPDIGPDSDYRDLSPEALAALKKANDGTGRRNACEDRFIGKYGKGA